jgi:hypothetical protein
MSAPDNSEPKVICVGMLRTGTFSLCAALGILGYNNVYHGLKFVEVPEHWLFQERAAEATWPEINARDKKNPPPPFTRADWDEFYAPFDALTDLACFYGPQLIEAYPEAKVILTIRPYEKWFPSFNSQVLEPLFGPWVDWFLKGVGTIVGNRAGFAMQKTISGFWGGANTLEAIHARAPGVFRAHNERIKAMVPPERLLVYTVGEGWESLCDFLGKPVPTVDFPRVNERDAHEAEARERFKRAMWRAGSIVGPYAVGIVAVIYGVKYLL